MNQAVLTDPAALGFVPALAIDPGISAMNLTEGGEPYLIHLPLLALTESEPEGVVREWLSCVQQQIAP